jgi:hypothetical protein
MLYASIAASRGMVQQTHFYPEAGQLVKRNFQPGGGETGRRNSPAG